MINNAEEIQKLGIKVIQADVLEKDTKKRILFQKKYLLRHDSHKLAKVIKKILINR